MFDLFLNLFYNMIVCIKIFFNGWKEAFDKNILVLDLIYKLSVHLQFVYLIKKTKKQIS